MFEQINIFRLIFSFSPSFRLVRLLNFVCTADRAENDDVRDDTLYGFFMKLFLSFDDANTSTIAKLLKN